MKVREFLETLAINNYFAISINELVDSKEYSSGELSIVVYDTKNIINMLSDTILNKEPTLVFYVILIWAIRLMNYVII